MFRMDLVGLDASAAQIGQLVEATAAREGCPAWTYSDIRTRLYPTALAQAYPDRALRFEDLLSVAVTLHASPVMEDK